MPIPEQQAKTSEGRTAETPNPNESAAERVEAAIKTAGKAHGDLPSGAWSKECYLSPNATTDLRTILAERAELLAALKEVVSVHDQIIAYGKLGPARFSIEHRGEHEAIEARATKAFDEARAALAKAQPQTDPLDQERGR